MNLVSHLQPPEREKEFHPSKLYTLECQDHDFSHWAKNLGDTRSLNYSDMFFTTRN